MRHGIDSIGPETLPAGAAEVQLSAHIFSVSAGMVGVWPTSPCARGRPGARGRWSASRTSSLSALTMMVAVGALLAYEIT